MSSVYDPSSWCLKTARIKISPESTYDAAPGIALLESELEVKLGNGFRVEAIMYVGYNPLTAGRVRG